MKKSILLIVLFIAFSGLTNAQKSKLTGSWLMIKAEVDGEVQRPLFVSEFKENGLLFMMGMELGTWNYNKSSNALVLKSEIGEEFNGSYEILNLTEQELEVDKEGAR